MISLSFLRVNLETTSRGVQLPIEMPASLVFIFSLDMLMGFDHSLKYVGRLTGLNAVTIGIET